MLVLGLDSVRLAAGAFGCLPGAFANGRQRKAPNDLFINQSRPISMLRNIKIASYSPNGKEKRGYGAIKSGADSANRCWCSVLRRAATQQ